jgi:hypothetical protein
MAANAVEETCMRSSPTLPRQLVLGAMIALGAWASMGGCGTTPRDEAMKRRAQVFAAGPGTGRLSVMPTGEPERAGTGRRTARDISAR